MNIELANELSPAPGACACYQTSGHFFLESLLSPKFESAKAENRMLRIDLDGVWGMTDKFIQDSFVALSSVHSAFVVAEHLIISASDNEALKARIWLTIFNSSKFIK